MKPKVAVVLLLTLGMVSSACKQRRDDAPTTPPNIAKPAPEPDLGLRSETVSEIGLPPELLDDPDAGAEDTAPSATVRNLAPDPTPTAEEVAARDAKIAATTRKLPRKCKRSADCVAVLDPPCGGCVCDWIAVSRSSKKAYDDAVKECSARSICDCAPSSDLECSKGKCVYPDRTLR